MPYGFNEDKSKAEFPVIDGNLATGVDLKDYYRHGTTGIYYTFPTDGYVNLTPDSNRVTAYVCGASDTNNYMQASAAPNTAAMFYVRANMRITIVEPFTVTTGLATFYALS